MTSFALISRLCKRHNGILKCKRLGDVLEMRRLIKKNSHNGLTMKRLPAYNPMRNAKKNSIYASQKGMPVGLSNYDGIKLRLSSGSISVSCCILEYRFQKTWVSDITA
ncbi:hypothetical protein T4E_1578 [Trichinella pseudospiralis]|uniref:Uncharacterized protein n=1 Tax=Trichinella pseudospiralis TaxID=6337 RepID=A0A0V0XNT7_TRIPS|nr:hypothetical protein T4E_1578 [Trichinella pseudospiralis]